MSIDHASYNNSGDGDAVSNLADGGRGAGESGRGYGGANVVVDYRADGDVGADRAGLQEEESFWEVVGILQLGHKVEECSIPRWMTLVWLLTLMLVGVGETYHKQASY